MASGPSGHSDPIGADGFCLVLLRRMADYQPALVDDAVRELGFTRTRMREVNARWQRMLRAPGGGGAARAYRAALGEPQGRTTRRMGDVTAGASWWTLPLWPDLRFEVLTAPGGRVWHEWLVRADPAAAPALGDVAALRPWSCVIDDVARAYPGVRHLAGSAPSRWSCLVPRPPQAGPPAACRADFVWGLLQRVEPAG